MLETNLVVKLGVDWSRVLTYKQSNGTVVNLTGYTSRLQVRATTSSQVKILDLTTENGGIVIDGVNGTITVKATALQLTESNTHLNLGSITSAPSTLNENLDNGVVLQGVGKIALYDLDIISPTSVITKLLSGSIVFEPSVTR